MGREKGRPVEERGESWPQRPEIVRFRHIPPRETVDEGETELPRRRTDEMDGGLEDPAARDLDEADRAGAVGAVVGRLEVDRDEIAGRTRIVRPLPPPAPRSGAAVRSHFARPT